MVAGGREPPHWEAYPHHQFLSTTGALSCCAEGGCWKSRCQPVGDGDEKDRNKLCEQPVQVRPDLRIPRCMTLIAPADVCRRIELYYAGEALRFPGPQATPQLNPATAGAEAAMPGHTEVNGYANRHAEAMSSRLVVDGAPTPLGADYVLRWVDQPDGRRRRCSTTTANASPEVGAWTCRATHRPTPTAATPTRSETRPHLAPLSRYSGRGVGGEGMYGPRARYSGRAVGGEGMFAPLSRWGRGVGGEG